MHYLLSVKTCDGRLVISLEPCLADITTITNTNCSLAQSGPQLCSPMQQIKIYRSPLCNIHSIVQRAVQTSTNHRVQRTQDQEMILFSV